MNMKKNTLQTMVLALLLILLDQSTKYLAVKYLQISKNTGIAFGIQIPQTILIVTNIVLLIIIVYIAKKELNFNNKYTRILTAAIMAGGLSNLADRLYHGYVIDFIHVPVWPSFNFADMYITAGILLVIIFYGKIKRIK